VTESIQSAGYAPEERGVNGFMSPWWSVRSKEYGKTDGRCALWEKIKPVSPYDVTSGEAMF